MGAIGFVRFSRTQYEVDPGCVLRQHLFTHFFIQAGGGGGLRLTPTKKQADSSRCSFILFQPKGKNTRTLILSR